MRHPVCWGCESPLRRVMVLWYRRSAATAMALFLTGDWNPDG